MATGQLMTAHYCYVPQTRQYGGRPGNGSDTVTVNNRVVTGSTALCAETASF